MVRFMLTRWVMGICSLSLLWAATFASAQVVGSIDEVIEPVGDKGEVNWTSGIISASGTGVFEENLTNPIQRLTMAKRAALTIARRNLLEVTKAVRIDSETTVENFIQRSDEIKTSVDGFIQGAFVTKETNVVGGRVEVTVQIELKGDFSDAVLFTAYNNTPQIPSSLTYSSAGPVFTGLLVDAKGLGIRPAMAPKIIDENGREVYGAAYVRGDLATKLGMVGYSKSIDTAKINERISENPLIVKGIKAAGDSGSDIVITSADAEKVRTAASGMDFLEKCRVMIVVD